MNASALHIRILGPVAILRNGKPAVMARSRKVRALLAYLVLEPGPKSRSRLCDLLWDVPNDPRGELRWCLSKLRGMLDHGDRTRVVTHGQDAIELNLSDCHVDAIAVDQAIKQGLAHATRDRLAELCDLFAGELLDGANIDGNPEFAGWLTAQRQRFRAMHVTLLGELATRLPPGSEEAFRCLDGWLELAPFDVRAHDVMLGALVQCGRIGDAEKHMAGTIRCFEQEGLDWSDLHKKWRSARAAPFAQATPRSAPALAQVAEPAATVKGRLRASVAVMPFVDHTSQPATASRMADGLTEDIITRLAKLRVLFVIARGTTYALGERGIGPLEAGRMMNVDYVASGSVRRHDQRLSVRVELARTEDARIVWADQLDAAPDEAFTVLDTLVDRIVAAIAEEIEAEECRRAILKPPASLDAWEAYHRGLWQMYRFNGPDNRDAEQSFRRAIELDPTFARAHAGLSFTHFQNAFLDLTSDRENQIARAFEAACKSMSADERDPAAHWAIGRALWLRGMQDEACAELERSIELSPNFALGHYTLGFVHGQAGDPRVAIDATNTSRQLSPFDPLQFGMLATRALAHVRLSEFAEAAEWAVKATRRPNAHAHILAIAAQCLGLSHRREEGRKLVAQIRERVPGYSVEQFLRSFHFAPDTEKLFRQNARKIGFDQG